MEATYRNAEGYHDPVPCAAIAEMERGMRRCRPIVYICSPFSGDIEGNTIKARKYCRFAVDRGVLPVAPHLYLPQFISEKTERKFAMRLDLEILTICKELWVFGEPTAGMKQEIGRAKQLEMKIRYFKEDVCK